MEASKSGGEQEPLGEEQNATPETAETKSELKDIINSKKAKDTTKGFVLFLNILESRHMHLLSSFSFNI